MNILVQTDNANLSTGMGRVGREISLGLQRQGHRITYLGWFSPLWLENKMPFKMHRTSNQYYGQDIFDSVIMEDKPDLVITIGDMWMVRYIVDGRICKSRMMFQWLGYIPIDGSAYDGGVPSSWISVIKNMDYKVAYTEFGKKTISKSMPEIKNEIEIIPHGVDTKVYQPISQEEIRSIKKNLGVDGKFIFLVVARNQPRKNIPEIMKAFKKFKAKYKAEDCLLWLHMNFQDPMGNDIDELMNIYRMNNDIVFFDQVAHHHDYLQTMTEPDLNKLYNICDCFMLISGEGFGLPILEAMACKKPVIGFNHSANQELVRERGYLVDVGYKVTGRYSTERPYPDMDDLVESFRKMYKDKQYRNNCAEKGYEFATKLTWENALGKWKEVIDKIEHPVKEGNLVKLC